MQNFAKFRSNTTNSTLLPKFLCRFNEKPSPDDPSLIKNFGYAALSKLCHALKIDYFINNRRRYTDSSYNHNAHNAIFKMPAYSRLINPGQLFDSRDSRTCILSTPFSTQNCVQVDTEYIYEIDEEKVPMMRYLTDSILWSPVSLTRQETVEVLAETKKLISRHVYDNNFSGVKARSILVYTTILYEIHPCCCEDSK